MSLIKMCVGLSCGGEKLAITGETGMGDRVSRAKPLRRKVKKFRASERSWREEQRHFLFHNRDRERSRQMQANTHLEK